MLFRNLYITRSLAIFVGVLFLNLSFILAEINALELEKKNRALYENLVRLLSGAGFEEEKDASAEASSELGNEVNMYFQLDKDSSFSCLYSAEKFRGYYKSSNILGSFRKIFSPPPES